MSQDRETGVPPGFESFKQRFQASGVFLGFVRIGQIKDQPTSFESCLSEQERAYYVGLSSDSRKYEFLGSRFVLKQCLVRAFSQKGQELTPGDITVQRIPDRAPTLEILGKERGDVYFSISHCKQYVFCGVSLSRKFGVDVEMVSDRPANVKDLVVQPEEQPIIQAILQDNSQVDEFHTKLWTAKEAAVKYAGTHMFDGLTRCVLTGSDGEVLQLDYHLNGQVIGLSAYCLNYNNHFFTVVGEP